MAGFLHACWGSEIPFDYIRGLRKPLDVYDYTTGFMLGKAARWKLIRSGYDGRL